MTRRSILKRSMPLVAAAVLVAAWQIGSGIAGPKATAASKGAPASDKAQYLVISPHTAEQCLEALDAVAAMPAAKDELASWAWGCMSGDHTGYLMTWAATPDEALKHVPEAERAEAKVIKVNQFTMEQIKSFHAMKK